MGRLVSLQTNVDSTIEKVSEVVFGEDCTRSFRMEVLTPDGERRYYTLKAASKSKAFKEAYRMITEMTKTFNDERIMWRLANSNWHFGTTIKNKQNPFKKALNYFFDLEQ